MDSLKIKVMELEREIKTTEQYGASLNYIDAYNFKQKVKLRGVIKEIETYRNRNRLNIYEAKEYITEVMRKEENILFYEELNSLRNNLIF